MVEGSRVSAFSKIIIKIKLATDRYQQQSTGGQGSSSNVMTRTYVLLRSQLNPFAAAAATLLYPGLQGFSLSSVLEGKELNFE